MKRTVTANISGIVFHIEEDAYMELDRYLKSIRDHLSDEEGLDEIMEDIESRIAELFKASIGDSKEVVTDKDVEDVIETIGKPEDFGERTEEKGEGQEKERGTTGSGPTKRVFRNPDDKILGGVCSGISAYLGWDPIWLRLLFVVGALAFGSGPLVYIILWIIIPEASTRAEKLQMQGEPVNLDNLKKKAKEEADDLKDRFGKFKEEVESEEFKKKGREIGDRIGEVLQSIFYWFCVILKRFGAIFLLLLGVTFAFVLMNIFVGGGDYFTFLHTPEKDYTFNEFLHRFIGDPTHSFLFRLGTGIFFGIPMLVFFYSGLKNLFDLRVSLKGFGAALFAFWIIGIIILAYSSAFLFGSTFSP